MKKTVAILGLLWVSLFIYSCKKESIVEINPPTETDSSAVEQESPSYVYGVLLSNLNIRTESSINADPISVLSKGERVEVVARREKKEKIDNLLGYWYLIRNDEVEGWAFGAYIHLENCIPEDVIPCPESAYVFSNAKRFSQSEEAWLSLRNSVEYLLFLREDSKSEANIVNLFQWVFQHYNIQNGFNGVKGIGDFSIREESRKFYSIEGVVGAGDSGSSSREIPYYPGIFLYNTKCEFLFIHHGGDKYDINRISEHYEGSPEKILEILKSCLGTPETDEQKIKDHFGAIEIEESFNPTYWFQFHCPDSQRYDDLPGVFARASGIGFQVTGENSCTISYNFSPPFP